MEFLRKGHDSFGEPVVNGASWDLLPVAFWAGVAVIVGHLIWRAISRSSARRRPGGTP
ncbi:MAG: hypothetical protein M3Y79_06005 [Pseudomonadota bacterium]|nr:hypothetical protein [Pseudomonadota bacterium]